MTSIREIARKAGVSPATVSRVLNRDKTFSIKNSTRQKVLNLAKSLHYELKPNRPSNGQREKLLYYAR
ncbi:LacI family DNA-binding transcriptional regulator [Lactobacillus mulieris]|nr:LacI family DNA-binding transcriptional regulator [Lactobacillus mulieris]